MEPVLPDWAQCRGEVGAWAGDGAEEAAGVEAADGATATIQWAFSARRRQPRTNPRRTVA
jgi:hypothetical protein